MSGSTSSRTGHRRYREQRDRLRRRARRNNEPCCFCGQPIDYDAEWPAPLSFTADHETPVSMGGASHGAGAVLRPAHAACNIAAGGANRPWNCEPRVVEPGPVVHYDAPELRTPPLDVQ